MGSVLTDMDDLEQEPEELPEALQRAVVKSILTRHRVKCKGVKGPPVDPSEAHEAAEEQNRP